MDFNIDSNLLITIWTGSAVPIIITFLGYFLVKRAESRRRTLEDKKKVYGELNWAIRTVASAMNDSRTLQLMQVTKNDAKEITSQIVKLVGLPSIWLSPECMDVLREVTTSEDWNKSKISQQSPADLKKAFEYLKAQMTMELAHYLSKNMDIMGRHNLEMERLNLPDPVKNALTQVFLLFGQMQQNTSASGLLMLAGLSSLDKGDDIGPWVTKMQTALDSLTKAMTEDLQTNV